MTDIVIEEQKVLLTVIENTEFRLFDLFYYQSIREPVISKSKKCLQQSQRTQTGHQ
jgi:hypothetical protein